MKLADLIKNLNIIERSGDINLEISGIAYDSRAVREGNLFVCIDGSTVDGHNFARQAVEQGAVALLVQKPVENMDVTQILINDTRKGLAEVATKFYQSPSEKFPVVGITGTKGKTTITYMVKSIFEHAGKRVGLIGTIANMIGDAVLYTSRTTPESLDLQELFSDMIDAEIDECVMEVSSQGLMLERVTGTKFKIGVFTNIEKDHIGPNEHSDFDDYLNQKLKIFAMSEVALINADSGHLDKILESSRNNTRYTYAINAAADIWAKDIKVFPDKVQFKLICNEKFNNINADIELSVPGYFNVSNALAAIGIALIRGISIEAIAEGLDNFSVKGRTEIVASGNGYTVMIDYAHNAMALESLLKSVREYAPGRIVCMFGCGGNRDRARRFEMGEVSGKYADFTIITSDNPRNESPTAIIDDIEVGINKTEAKYIKIENRREAMEYAIKNAQKDDIIIFAGKGHENYQIFHDKTIHFDEKEIVEEILGKQELK